MAKNRSAAGITNIVQYDANRNITFVSGSTTLLTVSSSGALTTTGTITAQTLVVQTVTSSVNFITGSTKFGSLIGNTHQFTGSVSMTGSLAVVTNGTEFQVTNTGVRLGNISTDAHTITGSISASGSAVFTDTVRILTGANTTDISYAVGKELSTNNTAFFGWRHNSGTPYGFISVFGTSGRFSLMPDGGNVLIGTTTDNSIAALQINGGAYASLGFKYTYSLGTISQNTTITQAIPNNGAGFYLISNGGNNSALFMITRAGGSLGCQLVFSTNGNADIVCGTTTEPAGGNYLRLWMSAVGVLSIKNVNAYTGPYYLTAIGTF